jgi:hypothetical protein
VPSYPSFSESATRISNSASVPLPACRSQAGCHIIHSIGLGTSHHPLNLALASRLSSPGRLLTVIRCKPCGWSRHLWEQDPIGSSARIPSLHCMLHNRTSGLLLINNWLSLHSTLRARALSHVYLCAFGGQDFGSLESCDLGNGSLLTSFPEFISIVTCQVESCLMVTGSQVERQMQYSLKSSMVST